MAEMLTSQLPLWSDFDVREGWVVRESRRARRLAVRVYHTGRVEVVVPTRTSTNAVTRFVNSHRNWIERKRAEAQSHATPAAPFPPSRIELLACGETWCVHLGGGKARVRVKARPGRLLILSGDSRDGRAVRTGLRRWLVGRAAEVLGPALDAMAREMGLEYARVLIRRQRTRWGSCSARGTISLNCCLLFQRPVVVRYLLVHELAHTRHLNHSRHFWQSVASHCPDYRSLDRELLEGWRRVPAWVFGEAERPLS